MVICLPNFLGSPLCLKGVVAKMYDDLRVVQLMKSPWCGQFWKAECSAQRGVMYASDMPGTAQGRVLFSSSVK
jgi:hypothetical protein